MRLSLLIVLALKYEVAVGLHITRVSVPTYIAVGEAGWLQCEFVKEGESVYALKWYLGLDEFYRWTPAEIPSVKTFPVKGNPLVVDKAQSDRGYVKIQNVRLGASGMFRCEVSGEAPAFHTASKMATMTVLDLPDEKPLITGVEAAYQIHSEVTVNCSSLRSQPPATLAFYINDEPADPSWVTHYPPIEDQEAGLETAVMGLSFPLLPRLLQQGPALVKCTAAIEDRYWESSIAAIHSDVPHQASVTEGRATATQGCGVSTSLVLTGGVSTWLLLRLLH